jgi:hypothetical protein
LTVRSPSVVRPVRSGCYDGCGSNSDYSIGITDWSLLLRNEEAVIEQSIDAGREPWNKGKLVGQKAPLKLKEIWAIRIRLQISNSVRDLGLFDLAIDSKLRACDLVKVRVRDVSHGDRITPKAIVMQQKTQRPVQFEITEATREGINGIAPDRDQRRSDCFARRTGGRGLPTGLRIESDIAKLSER